jgi:antitoxin MazE
MSPNKGKRVIKVNVQKWCNNLSIRIPGASAEQLQRPTQTSPLLEQLLAQITPENRHKEIDFGAVEGNELL